MSNKKLFNSLVFCISGTLSKGRKEVENEIKKYGGKTAASITKAVTHLITTEKEFEEETTKVSAAKEKEKIIVKEDFIWDSVKLGELQPATKYSFDNEDEEEEEEDDDDEADDGQDDLDFQPLAKKRKIDESEVVNIVKFTNFPLLDDLLFSIFKYVTIDELLLLSRVCKRFNDMITNENNESTITFLIQTMNNYIRSTRKVSEPYKFFSLLHDEQYSDNRPVDVPTEGEQQQEANVAVNISEDKLQRYSLNFEKFKEMVNRKSISVEKALQFYPNAKKEEFTSTLSLLESIKFRYAYDQNLLSSLRTAKITNGENFSHSFDEDNAGENNGPTFKGGLKKQLRLLKQHIESFDEINFGRYTEDSMDTPPKTYSNWIVKNSEILNNIKSIYYLDIDQSDAEVSWICIDDITPVLNAMPKLNFWMSKGSIQLALSANFSHHNLRSITFISAGLSEVFLRNLFTAYLPKLAHLELFLGTSNQGADFQPELLKEKLLSPKENGIFPSLEYLGLRNYESIDKICGDIFDSSISKRVKIIDISLGTLSDKGVSKFIDKLEGGLTTDFMGLEVLDMNRCYLSKSMRNRLLELPIIVDTQPADNEWDVQVNDEDDEDGDDMGDRYIAISE
ncbi:hypothetical protein NAEGRDRAFT_79764 [Naegleria gruberi]|uniref:BRCT domain-containing protein n=1 Tax=Naegleria gruberi TaxID=5762 RepID=D2VFH3_NAEGR|nr:uncharacterized protein NAEGRDRAFT_79764 [Naegleria gruberi]EFC44465.1 hypothetical protein NAEGRDRAFT_79764 [Naegleria gruberi]|eukprot:XP_002677209.1 hypothetical protein NAEGRDRAFT_79764 [Naegleria gruberi strain NEG-M]